MELANLWFGQLVICSTRYLVNSSFGQMDTLLTGQMANLSTGHLVKWVVCHLYKFLVVSLSFLKLVKWSYDQQVIWKTGHLANLKFGQNESCPDISCRGFNIKRKTITKKFSQSNFFLQYFSFTLRNDFKKTVMN